MANKYGYMAKIGLSDDGLQTSLKEIDSSLKEVDRSIAATDKAINNAGKAGLETTQLWEQQYDLLKTQIETTAEKLQGLESVQSKVAEAYDNGAIDYSVYIEFQNEIANTATKLENLKKRAEEANAALHPSADTSTYQTINTSLDGVNQRYANSRKELEEVNKALKVSGDNAQLMAQKNTLLGEAIHDAQVKLQVLTSQQERMNEAVRSGDTTAEEYRAFQREIANTQAELAALTEEQKNLGKAVEETGNKSEKGLEKTTDALKKVEKVAMATTAAVTAALGKLSSDALSAYSQYEQMVGGVETLFAGAEDIVLENARNAYKTAGISANSYMETVTGFSATLLQGLGGDTQKAASIADQALIDMADNANKMGTAMGSIQYAYQGFAKQNYTMLDNLKLGYGGTKEEMQRLLEDAEKLSGVKYDISSYSDIIDAIHVIQTEMDITGTTAKEAEATISGSIGMLKSSFQNLITGLGDADADIDKLCDNVVNSFNSVVKNITPVVRNLAKTVPNALEGILDAIAPLLPELLEMGVGLFEALLSGFTSVLPELMNTAASLVTTLVQGIIEALPLVVEAAAQFITTLVQGIAEALPTLIPAAVETVTTIVSTLIENISLLIDAALQLMQGLAEGVLEAIPVLLEALPELIESLVTTLLDAIPQIIETGVELLTALVENLPEIITTICEVLPQIIESTISTLLDHLPEIVEAGVKLLTALITNLPQIILTIVQALPQIITAVINALVNNIPKIIETGVKLLTALITNLPQIIAEIVRAMPQIITGIVSALGEGVSQVAEVGANLVRGLWQGIQSLAGWLWDKVSGWISSIWDGITDFFGIHSPSTKMAWVSEMNVEGAVVGIEKNKSKAVKAYGAMGEEMLAEVDSGLAAVNDKLKSSIGEIETGFSAKATVEAVSASVPADLTGRGGGATTSGGGDTNVVNHFHIAELVVREEADVKKISRELYNMQKSKSRSKGVSMA